MISVVIPALNAEARLPACLEALVAASLKGLVREVVLSDGGSVDRTAAIAEAAGAVVVGGARGRGAQLARGACAARKGRWLLFVHADTVLEEDWAEECGGLLADEERAGVFTLRFDDERILPRLVAAGATARTKLLKAPYGDQGLLISRALYDRIGGFSDLPLFEDVDLIDRLIRAKGRRALHVFRSRAVTSAERYRRDGYVGRVLKNIACLAMFRAGVAPAKIAGFYRS